MIRQSAQSMLSLLVMGVGKALFVLLTANFYGPEGQGIVTLGISVMVASSLFLGLGADLAGTLLVGRDPSRFPALRTNSLLLSLVSSVVALGVLDLAFRLFGDTVFKDFPSGGYSALVVLVGLQVLHVQIHGLAVGLGRFSDLSVANSLQFMLLIAGVIALHLARQPVVTVLFLWAAGLAVKVIFLMLRLPSPAMKSSESRSGLLKQQLAIGPQMMLGNLANLLNFRLDAYFIAYFLPASQLGLYAVAATIAEAVLYLPKALGQVVFSWASQTPEDSRAVEERIRNVFLVASYATLALVLCVQLVLRPALSLLFGEPFLGAMTPARFLLLASVAYGIGLVAMNLIYGFGNPGWNTRAGMAAVVLNAVGNVFAIPQWGIMGAAWTSLASYVIYCTLNLANVRRYLPSGTSYLYLLVPDRKFLATSLQMIQQLRVSLRK